MVEVVAAIDHDVDPEETLNAYSRRTAPDPGKSARPDKVSLSAYSPVPKTKVLPDYNDQVSTGTSKIKGKLWRN